MGFCRRDENGVPGIPIVQGRDNGGKIGKAVSG